MENNINAFPNALISPDGQSHLIVNGMTLLDYFAAKAMQAIVSKMYEPKEPHLACVEDAYHIANHMLESRKNWINHAIEK